MKPKKRIPALDLLRGVFLAVMAFDHWAGRLPELSAMTHLTFRPIGFFSAAHGFFFLSGYTLGVTQLGSEPILADPLRRKLIRRATQLYLAHLVCMGLLAIGASLAPELFVEFIGSNSATAAPLALYFRTAVFLDLSGIAKILPLYILFLLAVALFKTLRTTPPKAWVLSSVLWLLAQTIAIPSFNALGFQFLFLLGMSFGRESHSLQTGRAPPRTNRALISMSALFSLFCFYLRHFPADSQLLRRLSDVASPGPLVVANLLAIAFLVQQTSPLEWKDRALLRPLTLLGRNSLVVYTAHFSLLMGLIVARARVAAWKTEAQIALLLILFAFTALIAFVSERIQFLRTNSRSSSAPVPAEPLAGAENSS